MKQKIGAAILSVATVLMFTQTAKAKLLTGVGNPPVYDVKSGERILSINSEFDSSFDIHEVKTLRFEENESCFIKMYSDENATRFVGSLILCPQSDAIQFKKVLDRMIDSPETYGLILNTPRTSIARHASLMKPSKTVVKITDFLSAGSSLDDRPLLEQTLLERTLEKMAGWPTTRLGEYIGAKIYELTHE